MRTLTTSILLMALVGFTAAAPSARAAPAEDPRTEPRKADDPRTEPRKADDPRTEPERPVERRVTDTKQLARDHFAKGSQHYAKERYPEAITEFKTAYKYWKNPRILLNIAICYSEMNKPLEAVLHLRKALKTATPEQKAKLQTKVPAALRARENQVADLEVVMPAGAQIYINGELAGASPVKRVLLPGTVRVEVKHEGKVQLKKTLELKGGDRRSVTLLQWPTGGDPNKKSWRARFAKLPWYYAVAAGALAVAGTAALIGTGVRTEQIQDDYYGSPDLDTRSKGIRLRTATNVLIGVTVTAAVAAGVLAFFTDWRSLTGKKEEAKKTLVIPTAGPGGFGLSASGSF